MKKKSWWSMRPKKLDYLIATLIAVGVFLAIYAIIWLFYVVLQITHI